MLLLFVSFFSIVFVFFHVSFQIPHFVGDIGLKPSGRQARAQQAWRRLSCRSCSNQSEKLAGLKGCFDVLGEDLLCLFQNQTKNLLAKTRT